MPSTTLGSRLRGHQPRRLRRRPRAAPTPATSTTTPACSAANPCSRSPSPSACSASSAPPTAVFVGKLSLFGAAIDSGRTWLAIVAIVNTVASVFYYLRWLADAYRRLAEAPLTGPVSYRGAAITVGVL